MSKKLAEGTGTTRALANDIARVYYTVWKNDGTLVQHVEAPKSATLPIWQMIPGWGQAVAQMVAGEKRRVWIPAKLAYAKDKTKPQGMLVFDIELLGIK